MACVRSLVRGGEGECWLNSREYVKTAIEFPANNGSKEGKLLPGQLAMEDKRFKMPPVWMCVRLDSCRLKD